MIFNGSHSGAGRFGRNGGMVMKINTMVRKALAMLTVSAAALGMSVLTANAYDLENHTKADIINAYERMHFDIHQEVNYDVPFSEDAPFEAGSLDEESMQNALNAVNFCRYLAGLPSDVELRDDYNNMAQSAALINYLNNELEHYPEKTPGMSDPLYNAAAEGAHNANLAYADLNPAASVLGYMNDTDGSNVSVLGHRRWILNPDMKYTGMGTVNNYTAMYAHDKSRAEVYKQNFTGDYILWPPSGYVPYEIIGKNTDGYAYSVTLGNDYKAPDISEVVVTVKSQLTGQTIVFDKPNKYTSSFFGVNNGLYGTGKCIIFNPGDLPENDTITVNVTGIYKTDGSKADINYTVKYFNMFDESEFTVDFPQKTYTAEVGQTVYVNGYDNPLSDWDYTIWSNPRFSELRDEGVVIYKQGSAMYVKCNTERKISIYMGDNENYYSYTKTVINFTHAHTRSDWIVDKEPDEFSPGKRHRVCTECGVVIDEEIVSATSLEAAEIKIYGDSFIYMDQPVEPRISVTSSGVYLRKDIDYTVSYKEYPDDGKGIVTVEGIGDYTGSTSAEYTLEKPKVVSIAEGGISVQLKFTTVEYTGDQISLQATVKEGSIMLKQGRDYYIEYDENFDCGTHTAKIIGMEKYAGEVEKEYTIISTSIPSPFKGDFADVEYDGTPKTVSITVKNPVSGKKLVENRDYTVEYKNNVNVGQAVVIVKGINNYKGMHSATFNILPNKKNMDIDKDDKTDDTEPTTEPTAMITVAGTAPSNGTKIVLVDASTNKEYEAEYSSGLFNVSAPEGKYNVWVSCEGYCPRKYECTIGSEPLELNAEICRFGDVDMDSEISIADAAKLINSINGVAPLGDYQSDLADIDVNGTVDIGDAVAIINNINGVKGIDTVKDVDFNAVPDELDEDEVVSSDEDMVVVSTDIDSEADEAKERYTNEDGKVYVITEEDNVVTIVVYADETEEDVESRYVFDKNGEMTEVPEEHELIDEEQYTELLEKLTKI